MTRAKMKREPGTETMAILKNGGWRNCGEFVTIRKELEIGGKRTQICSYTRQLDENGVRRSRNYYEVRTAAGVIQLPAAVKSLRAAIEAANKIT